MLVNGKDLLAIADANSFAVPAFNVADYSMFNGIIEICEKKNAPVIIAIHPNEIAILRWDVVRAIRERLHRASVPAAIHWDHGASYEQIIEPLHGGFTSVMIDKSTSPFEENVAETARVVKTAHLVGVSVEGELGTIGKTDGYAEVGTADIIYTEPDDAARFIAETGVDSLAIAIGTRHGIYPSHLQPQLELDRLKEIKKAAPIPLVLHGGSNNPDDEIAEAARTGVNKINISSDIKVAYYERMREVLQDKGLREPDAIQPPCIEALQRVAAHKIDLFGATDRSKLY